MPNSTEDAASKVADLLSSCTCSMTIHTRAFCKPWSSTLQLPKSLFPPRPVLADRSKYLRRCTDDLYAWQRDAKTRDSASSGKIFVLQDGPPYANGSLHIGHALNKILKDITCRFRLSQGRRVEYVPGWDCHGLPIELRALQRQKELGNVGEDRELGPVAVRRIARELAASTIEEQKRGFREWAVMADWDNGWKTMDKAFEMKQLGVFNSMVEKGLIYRSFKPVYWSPSSRTALAEGELEYNADHVSTSAFIKFALQDLPPQLAGKLGLRGESINALIWTTTPWTLPANKAIAVHKDLDYVLMNSPSYGNILIAASRVDDVIRLCHQDLSVTNFGKIRGSELIGALYYHPTLGKQSALQQILHADFVSAESGSGLVHVAPGHGMDDYRLGQDHGIDPFAPVDEYGHFTDDVMITSLIGKNVLDDGNKAVLDHLSDQNAVFALHKYKHSYPYDWRSKKPIIIRATAQWFADVGEIRSHAIQALDNVTFIPPGGKERLSSFVRQRSEWCISRQRAWGVPIPALYQEDNGEAILTSESVAHIISVIENRGVDAWWTDEEFETAWIPPSLRNGARYRRGKDTMDVWFDSGTSWTQLGQNGSSEQLIADMYLEGTDQHRGWFQSSLLTKIAFAIATGTGGKPEAPFRTLVTHGFTLDQTGRKMSKSEGNVISPEQIMDGSLLPPIKKKGVKRKGVKRISQESQALSHDAMGPDALRLWVAGCDYTKDVIVGPSVLEAVNHNLLKLRNTFKLLLGMLETHKVETSYDFSQLDPIDQIALMQVHGLKESVQRHYEQLEYHKVVSSINQYVSTQLSAFYIESIKDRMYADSIHSTRRKQTQSVLWEIFKNLSSMLAPITPLLVQEACDYIPPDLVFDPIKQAWQAEANDISGIGGPLSSPLLRKDLEGLLAINTAVKYAQEAARNDKKMGPSLQSFVMLEICQEDAEDPVRDLLGRHLKTLEDLLVVSDIQIARGTLPLAMNNPKLAWSYTAECLVRSNRLVAHVYAPLKEKCHRCWKYIVEPEVSHVAQSELPEMLCPRCDEVVKGLQLDQ